MFLHVPNQRANTSRHRPSTIRSKPNNTTCWTHQHGISNLFQRRLFGTYHNCKGQSGSQQYRFLVGVSSGRKLRLYARDSLISNNIFVTDASFGAATLALSSTNIATVQASTKIADQAATCWATISGVTGTGFVTDVAVNHLVEVDTGSGALIKELNLTNGNPGMIDLEAAGNFIYALSPGNATVSPAVTVFDVSGGSGSKPKILPTI
jgi:hypothetical protein